jgi:FkbM family methyltransferase
MNKVVHQAVIKLGIAEFLVGLKRRTYFLRRFVPANIRHKFTSVGKFIPHSSSYPKDDCYFLMRDNTAFKINRSDYVQWRIFFGVPDNALKHAKQLLSDNGVVLDIGANCGAFSLKLATHAADNHLTNVQIHAFEPNLEIFKSYKSNLQLNPQAEKYIQVYPIGFGSESGKKSFHVPDTNSGVGRISNKEPVGTIEVQIERLDDFINKLNPPKISFIKLIVEGYEPEVLKGGWNTLKKYRPPIFFEATEEWYRENKSSVAAVLKDLQELGYKFLGEYHNNMIEYDALKFKSVYQYNVLAYHDSTNGRLPL